MPEILTVEPYSTRVVTSSQKKTRTGPLLQTELTEVVDLTEVVELTEAVKTPVLVTVGVEDT